MARRHRDRGASEGGTPLDEAIKVGYLGVVGDDRPNEDYTVEGVTSAPDVTDDAYADAKANEAKKAAEQAVGSFGTSKATEGRSEAKSDG